MPLMGLCLKLITYALSVHKVVHITSIPPSEVEFLLFIYCASNERYQIRSPNCRIACQLGILSQSVLRGRAKLNNWYYILKLINMWWGVQQGTTIDTVRLSVLAEIFSMSNTLTQYLLHKLK
jgi:hypothetical protein